jgi:hypothetical protein
MCAILSSWHHGTTSNDSTAVAGLKPLMVKPMWPFEKH